MKAKRGPFEKAIGSLSHYRVSAKDVHSPVQFLADVLFIVGLSIGTGIAFHEFFRGTLGSLIEFMCTGLAVACLFGLIGHVIARRHLVTLTGSFDRLWNAVESWSFAIAAFVFLLFTFKAGTAVSRGAVLSLYLVGLPLIAAWRVFTPLMVSRLVRKAGVATRECIIIGDVADPLLGKFTADLRASGSSAPEVLTFKAACLASYWGSELKDLAARVADAARNRGPGDIYICAGAVPTDRLSAIARALAVIPRAIFVVPDAQTSSLVRCKPAIVGLHIALELRREPLGPVQRVLKRALDFFVAASALLFLSPLFALVSAAIKIDSRGPVFFRQTRNGYQGKPFKIWKFRSMRVLEDGVVIKQAQRDDPRVTRIGRLLRKSSLDELPQLINILVGDMSLVGPRPHAQAHDALYIQSIENYEIRQHVKPGLTGWAQVNGLRGETATLDLMYRRIEYDLWYAANASVFLDIEILARTAIEVLRDRNVY
jgi:undecaprenyl-phosphate galactose phosphotransferase/putative colanic acid biosynthesis UDP-glucose lipid carrier transferase